MTLKRVCFTNVCRTGSTAEYRMAVRGYLSVTVSQASSRTKANEVVWDDNFREGFVKGVAAVLCSQVSHRISSSQIRFVQHSGSEGRAPQCQGDLLVMLAASAG